MDLVEGMSKNVLGAVVIRSKIGPALARAGFEKKYLFPAIEVGLAGWERAHSQGSGTGHESPHGILYAPQQVNQYLQRLGIERYLKELFGQTPPETELWLITETYRHSGTSRLKEIVYRVVARKDGEQQILFEAGIEVQDRKVNPIVTTHAQPLGKRF